MSVLCLIVAAVFIESLLKFFLDIFPVKEATMKLKKFPRYESCVTCGSLTDQLRDKDVEYRNFYIEGSGQLCYTCYLQFYSKQSHTYDYSQDVFGS